MTVTETADNLTEAATLITLRGGKSEFEAKVQNWLEDHEGWQPADIVGSDTNNLLLLRVSFRTADAIYLALSAGDEPDGLHEALVPTRNRYSKRFVAGKDARFYDTAGERMAQSGRKVGVTPREMAEKGGW